MYWLDYYCSCVYRKNDWLFIIYKMDFFSDVLDTKTSVAKSTVKYLGVGLVADAIKSS